MLGIVRPCRHHLSPALHRRWMAHLCGTCLTLRDGHGQLARTATNVDALLVSVLTAAQTETPTRDRRAGPCPARGMRTATVVSGEGAQLAAHAALLLAAGHLTDHVDDGQGVLRHRPAAALTRKVADRWSARARATAPRGFDPAALLAVPARQHAIEHAAEHDTTAVTLETATAPTADAVSAAFAHTAVLAGRPANIAPLATAGAVFGRLAHLLDALDDLDDDRRAGRWNPIDATGAGVAATQALARRQVEVLGATLPVVDLPSPHALDARLAHRLLVHETDRAVSRTLLRSEQPSTDQPPHPGDGDPHRPPRGFFTGCAAAAGLCCTGQLCCADPITGPWSGQPRSNPCASWCDCTSCSCDCCDSCSGDGCCCDGCCCGD